MLIYTLLTLPIILAVFALINYIISRDEDRPPWKVKLWLVPVLSLLMLAPLALIVVVIWYLFVSFTLYTDALTFVSTTALVTTAIYVIVIFLLADTFVHPFVYGVFTYLNRGELSMYAKEAIAILLDAALIYTVFQYMPGVAMDTFLSAFTLSVMIHALSWVVLGAKHGYKRYRM